MNVLVIGASGFIGRSLMQELEIGGHTPVAVSRDPKQAAARFYNRYRVEAWDGNDPAMLAALLTHADAVVNLAGENITAGKWTKKRRRLIIDSRVKTGNILAEAFRLATKRPGILLQGSAIGIYGTHAENPHDESNGPGTGFNAELTLQWEESVSIVSTYKVRLVTARTGLVLGNNGGLLDKMLLPFRFYSGTVPGSGKQWLSWIHMEDQTGAMRFLLENPSCHGPFNLTAPNPVRMQDFIGLISKITHRPAWIKIPGPLLTAALGEMARETILASQQIIPSRLIREGYRFRYTDPGDALVNLLQNGGR